MPMPSNPNTINTPVESDFVLHDVTRSADFSDTSANQPTILTPPPSSPITEEIKMPCDCPNCRRDNIINGTLVAECNHCHGRLDALSSFKIMGDKTLVCDSCVSIYYVKCGCCDKFYNKTEAKVASHYNHDDLLPVTICPRCFSLNYRECNECHNFFNRNEITSHRDVVYCRHCFNLSYESCTNCGCIKRKGEISHVRHTPNSGDRIYKVCDECWGYFGPVTEYGSKPKLQFQGKPPHYFGVELEVELENGCKKERGLKAQEVIDLFGDFVIVKEDGSLCCGFEICTQPASKDEHLIRWGKFFDKLPTNLVSFNSKEGRCGLHVHCSKKPLSLLTIAKIVVFVNDDKNKSYIETIAGRKANHFSNISKKEYAFVHQVLKDGSRSNRYEAVNLINKDTIEFRIFKGTLKRESFFKAIEFCDSLIQFCMTGNHGIAYCRDWTNYVNYVEVNSKNYPHLHAFILAKSLRKGEKKITEKETKFIKQFGFVTPDIQQ